MIKHIAIMKCKLINFLLFFTQILFIFNVYSMELCNKTIPKELFKKIVNCFLKIPTHVQEIFAQDKKVLSCRQVCKKWELFFNEFFQMRLDNAYFESIKHLFIQERRWDDNFFMFEYEKRINDLKKTLFINSSAIFLDLISKHKAIMYNDQSTQNLPLCNPIFDWSIVKLLGYKKSWPLDEIAYNQVPLEELSFNQLYNYLANGGFLSKALVKRLILFLLRYLDAYIKCGQKAEDNPYVCNAVFKYIYFHDEKFNIYLLNMNFSYFLAKLFCQMHAYGTRDPLNFTLHHKNDYLLKKVFKDFSALPFDINYQEFIEYMRLTSWTVQKNYVQIFFDKLEYYFSRNNFEGRFFFQHLLKYRLKYYKNFKDIITDKFSLITNIVVTDKFLPVMNVNRIILYFIIKFKNEIKNCSINERNEYQRLFNSDSSLDFLQMAPCTMKKNLKREKKIEDFLTSFL